MHVAEHLAAAGLVETDRRIDQADGLQHPRDAQGGELAGQQRLRPTGGHETLGGEVVDLVRPHVLDDRDDRQLVQQVGLVEGDPVVQTFDPLEVLRAGAADHAVDLVALLQQKLGQIGPVLPGDAGNQRLAGHESLF